MPTLGDRLLETSPGARVVSLSPRIARPSCSPAETSGYAAYWYDQDQGRFVTSPVYRPSPRRPRRDRRRLQPHEQAGAVLPARFGLLWKKLPPPSLSRDRGLLATRPRPTSSTTSSRSNGLGCDHDLDRRPARLFLQSLRTAPSPTSSWPNLPCPSWRTKPSGSGVAAHPTSCSSRSRPRTWSSHSYGTESEENLDVLRRLDLHLGRAARCARTASAAGQRRCSPSRPTTGFR